MCGSGSAEGRFFATTGRFAAFDAEHAIAGVKDVRGVVCFRIYPVDRMNVFTAD